MSRVFKFRMPAGIVGSVSRVQDATIVPGIVDTTVPPTGFGEPVKVVADKIQGMATGDTAAGIYGFLVRPYPTQNNGTGVPGTQPPYSIGVADVLRRGWIVVQLNGATAAVKRGKVYTRIAGAVTDKPIGGIEAAADVAVTSAAKGGGNTGTGTVGSLTTTSGAKPGAYTVAFTAATAFTVTDPDGIALQAGATGAAYSAGGIGFTITAGGTAFIAGDGFVVTKTQNTLEIPNAEFNGPAAAGGEVEIAYNI